jgi:hypothetical protein
LLPIPFIEISLNSASSSLLYLTVFYLKNAKPYLEITQEQRQKHTNDTITSTITAKEYWY